MSLFVWGLNSENQLANKKSVIWEPSPFECLQGTSISKVSLGDSHSMILTEFGELYSFGRNREYQLGTMHKSTTPEGITKVSLLEHETLVDCCAGNNVSYAITAAGRVYHWGLIYSSSDSDQAAGDENVTAASGRLTGIYNEHRDERLRRVLKRSTETWMRAVDETDTYYDELNEMGYKREDDDAKVQSREREYHGAIQLHTSRTPTATPQIVPSLSSFKIVSISTGFAHTMAIDDSGQLYACGFNDSGQLGLSNRISTSTFQLVTAFIGKTVLQVACGQAHNIARVRNEPCIGLLKYIGQRGLDLGRVRSNSIDSNDAIHEIGADVYTWGSGTLGQLGHGRFGVTKGRLRPTLLVSLKDLYENEIIDVAAGMNHTVCVTQSGRAYSWGNSSYGQMGSLIVAGHDYIDEFKYYTPQRVEGLDDVHITRVKCGSCYTLALTNEGNLMSWGWNSYSVLGHGKAYHGHFPFRIAALGGVDKHVLSFEAGANHCCTLTQWEGYVYASTYQPLSSQSFLSSYADVKIVLEDTSSVFYSYQAILACRSRYLNGYLAAARSDEDSHMLVPIEDIRAYKDDESVSTAMNHPSLVKSIAPIVRSGESRRMTVIYLKSSEIRIQPSTFQCLLDYIYTDRVTAPLHKRHHLYQLARLLQVNRLEKMTLLSMPKQQQVVVQKQLRIGKKSAVVVVSNPLIGIGDNHINNVDHQEEEEEEEEDNTLSSSTFIDDISQIVCSSDLSDVKLISFDDDGMESVIYAHQCILARCPYFAALLNGNFSDSNEDVSDHMKTVSLMQMNHDGINSHTCRQLLEFIYTGVCSNIDKLEPDMTIVMNLLVAASRVGVESLSYFCEQIVSEHLNDFPENMVNCIEFAKEYNFPRLERQCQEGLRSLANRVKTRKKTIDDDEDDNNDGQDSDASATRSNESNKPSVSATKRKTFRQVFRDVSSVFGDVFLK